MSEEHAPSSEWATRPALTEERRERHSLAMRRLRLLAFGAAMLFVPLGCEDSSGSSSGASFNPEAGPGFEAGASPDAGPSTEAGTDSAPPAPLGVTVTVTDDARPSNKVRIILHDAAGLVIGERVTDATGKVTLEAAPSMVTVLVAHGAGVGSSVAPVTFVGVADGDKLVVAGAADVVVDPTVIGRYSVSFSNAGVAASANSFNVSAGDGCSGSGAPGEPAIVDLFAGCLASKNAVLSEAMNGASLVGFGFAKDVGKPAAGPPPGVIDVGPLAFTTPGTTTLSASNLPPTILTRSQDLRAIANGVGFSMSYASGVIEAGGVAFKTPTGFAEAYQSSFGFGEPNASSTSTRLFIRRESVPVSGTLTSFDCASALPRITDAPLTMPMVGRPEVTVTSAATLAAADGGIATFRWSDALAETSGTWTLVFPPSTTTVRVPALPADAAAFVPAEGVAIDEVAFLEATQIPGYKELKTLPVQPSFGVELLSPSKPLPLAGTVRVSRWTPRLLD